MQKKHGCDAEILQYVKGKSAVQADSTLDTDVMTENSNNRRGGVHEEVRPQFHDEMRPRRLELPLIIHMSGLTEQNVIFILMALLIKIN